MSSYKGNIGLISWKSPKHNYGRDSNLEEVELKTFRYQSRSLIVKKKMIFWSFHKMANYGKFRKNIPIVPSLQQFLPSTADLN